MGHRERGTARTGQGKFTRRGIRCLSSRRPLVPQQKLAFIRVHSRFLFYRRIAATHRRSAIFRDRCLPHIGFNRE